jgi:hypothetical protein
MPRLRLARWLAVIGTAAAVLVGTAGPALAVDPCPGDRARAQNSYEHYVAAYNAGDQAGAAYWRDRYTQDWNIGHAHHCW